MHITAIGFKSADLKVDKKTKKYLLARSDTVSPLYETNPWYDQSRSEQKAQNLTN